MNASLDRCFRPSKKKKEKIHINFEQKEESEERSRPEQSIEADDDRKERFERATFEKEKIIIDDFYVGLTKKSMVNIFTQKKKVYLERLAKKNI